MLKSRGKPKLQCEVRVAVWFACPFRLHPPSLSSSPRVSNSLISFFLAGACACASPPNPRAPVPCRMRERTCSRRCDAPSDLLSESRRARHKTVNAGARRTLFSESTASRLVGLRVHHRQTSQHRLSNTILYCGFPLLDHEARVSRPRRQDTMRASWHVCRECPVHNITQFDHLSGMAMCM